MSTHRRRRSREPRLRPVLAWWHCLQRAVRVAKRHDAANHYYPAWMRVWISEQALEVIITALQKAAEARLARVDAAMRYHEILEAIAEGPTSRASLATSTAK
jgi:hypothetical protein